MCDVRDPDERQRLSGEAIQTERLPDEQAIANPYPQQTRILGGKVKREINYFHIRNLINFNFHFDHVSAF